MSKEYETLQQFIKRLRGIHQEAYTTFLVYERLGKLRAPNIVGEDAAQRAADAMSEFTGFFTSAERALNLYFLISLAKVFDYHKSALRLDKLIDLAEQNRDSLTVDDFKDAHHSRAYLEQLAKAYEGISRDVLLSFATRLDTVKPIVTKLKSHRDTKLAHENLRQLQQPKITAAEIKKLLDLSHDILNVFTSKLSHESTSYEMLERQSTQDTNNLLQVLTERRQQNL